MDNLAPLMEDLLACVCGQKILLVGTDGEPQELKSPYSARVEANSTAPRSAEKRPRRATLAAPAMRVTGLTRGRLAAEVCYAISSGGVSAIFAQKLDSREERRLFHSADVSISEIDFSFADEAFACTVAGPEGTSAIGLLSDDGKGVRTITEGDVLDRSPRWVPGGVGQIVYASSGIGRNRSGAWAGRTPFSLQRLNLRDSSVEVLVSDSQYDYLAPVPISNSLLFALRRPRSVAQRRSSFFGALRAPLGWLAHAPPAASTEESTLESELVRITPKGVEALTPGVRAFDVTSRGDLIYYSNGQALFRMTASKSNGGTKLVELAQIEQIVVR